MRHLCTTGMSRAPVCLCFLHSSKRTCLLDICSGLCLRNCTEEAFILLKAALPDKTPHEVVLSIVTLAFSEFYV